MRRMSGCSLYLERWYPDERWISFELYTYFRNTVKQRRNIGVSTCLRLIIIQCTSCSSSFAFPPFFQKSSAEVAERYPQIPLISGCQASNYQLGFSLSKEMGTYRRCLMVITSPHSSHLFPFPISYLPLIFRIRFIYLVSSLSPDDGRLTADDYHWYRNPMRGLFDPQYRFSQSCDLIECIPLCYAVISLYDSIL